MNKLILALVAVLVVGAVGFFLLQQKQSSSITTTTGGVVSPNTVIISNFAFNPNTLTVKAGTTVTWQNNDAVTHSIKSTTFNSSDLAQGDKFQFTFTTKGTYNYSCRIHPTMTGTIIVE